VKTASGFDWGSAPLGSGVHVLRVHPSGLAALGKPAGVLSHPNKRAEEPRALLTARYDEKEQCFVWTDAAGEERRVWLLHRLDSATSGLVLVATRAQTAVAVREAFELRQVRKRYVAVVLGHTRERQSRWRDALEVHRESGAVRASTRGGAPAETAMRCLRPIPGPPALSVLELEPLTGRTHQLRVQCARRHLPILGDQNYGDFKRNRELARRFGTDRLFLHARDVELEFPLDGGRVHFAAESPLPAEFQAFLKG
jgi:23S rRNA-/tRNA-specific pseudouridylate synthase